MSSGVVGGRSDALPATKGGEELLLLLLLPQRPVVNLRVRVNDIVDFRLLRRTLSCLTGGSVYLRARIHPSVLIDCVLE
jgi:hypothetical protein